LVTASLVSDNGLTLVDVMFVAKIEEAVESQPLVVENTFAAELAVVKRPVVLVTASLVSDIEFTLVDVMFVAKFEVAVESEPLVV